MEQTLLDTFEGMKMTDRQKNLFADVMVDRIQLYRNKKLMCVNLKSSHIIPYREIRLVRHNLETVIIYQNSIVLRISGRSIRIVLWRS